MKARGIRGREYDSALPEVRRPHGAVLRAAESATASDLCDVLRARRRAARGSSIVTVNSEVSAPTHYFQLGIASVPRPHLSAF